MYRTGDAKREVFLTNEGGGDGSMPTSPSGSKAGQLSSELKVLKLEWKTAKLKKKLKSKNPKGQEVASSPSSNEEGNRSSDDDESSQVKKGKGKKKYVSKPSYNSTSFNYDTLPSNHSFASMHSGKTSHFSGMNYAKWCHKMKVHLVSLSPSIWKGVCRGVDFFWRRRNTRLQPTSTNPLQCSSLKCIANIFEKGWVWSGWWT
jgi:hypothetical protein